MIGTTLSHYRIVAELGRGGMGIVYKAEDTKLDRTVALKVLPAAALSSEDDRTRFYREAKAAAQLNHPHIAAVHEIDEAVPEGAHTDDKRPFIAMEFIDGKSLEAKAKEGPMALEEVVRLSMQVANALEAAHEKNIVHRDIKSANIMLTAKGDAKVLDFGLAKTAHSTMLTRMGSTLGTVSYMSPEQARGENVDHRTYLWALGIIMYELISGRLPFGGDYEQAVTYSILNEDAQPLTAIRTGVPMGLEWIVAKLLAKNAEDRYQSAKDLIVDLRTVDLTSNTLSRTRIQPVSGAIPTGEAQPSQAPSNTSKLVWLASLVGVLLLGAAVGWSLRSPMLEPGGLPQKFELNIPGVYNAIYLEVSQDGKHLVFTGQDSTGVGYQTYLYDIVTKELKVLQRNVGDRYTFSPDGTRLAYRQGRLTYTIPVLGGTPTAVGEYGSGWPNFTTDGAIVQDFNESLWLYDGSGSKPRQISQVDSLAGEGGHYVPWPLPDGQHLLFHVTRTTGEGRQLGVLDMKTGEHRILGPGASPLYLNSGHILYVDGSSSSSGQMLLRPFDAKNQEWTGPPVAIAEVAGSGQIAVDRNGTMFSTLKENQTGSRRSNRDAFLEISSGSRSERPLSLLGEFTYHRVSPDGRFIAYAIDLDNNGLGDYISVYDRETEVSQRLSLNGDSNFAAWSKDGKRLYIELDSALEMWSIETMSREKVFKAEGLVAEFDVSPDELTVAYINHGSQESGDLRLLDLNTGDDQVLVKGANYAPRYSPDGQFILITDLGQQLLVVSLLDGTVRPVSRAGEQIISGTWAKDGYIYYISLPSTLKRLPVSTTNGLRVMGQSEDLGSYQNAFSLDVTDKGDTILLLAADPNVYSNIGQQGVFKVDVTTNWFDEARRIAPSSK